MILDHRRQLIRNQQVTRSSRVVGSNIPNRFQFSGLRRQIVPRPIATTQRVFDGQHYAATLKQKVIRSLQLGPKYYFWDLPHYFSFRHSVGLPAWDGATLLNPFREFSSRINQPFDMPPTFEAALDQLRAVGVRVALPRLRLMGVVGVWWSCRNITGDVIECGSVRRRDGASSRAAGPRERFDAKVFVAGYIQRNPAAESLRRRTRRGRIRTTCRPRRDSRATSRDAGRRRPDKDSPRAVQRDVCRPQTYSGRASPFHTSTPTSIPAPWKRVNSCFPD